jgi:hypothetical protein
MIDAENIFNAWDGSAYIERIDYALLLDPVWCEQIENDGEINKSGVARIMEIISSDDTVLALLVHTSRENLDNKIKTLCDNDDRTCIFRYGSHYFDLTLLGYRARRQARERRREKQARERARECKRARHLNKINSSQ